MSTTPEKKAELRALLQAWHDTDTQWTAALMAAFPRKWPGDVRYTDAGIGQPGTPLRAAYDAWRAAKAAFNAAGGFESLFDIGPARSAAAIAYGEH